MLHKMRIAKSKSLHSCNFFGQFYFFLRLYTIKNISNKSNKVYFLSRDLLLKHVVIQNIFEIKVIAILQYL